MVTKFYLCFSVVSRIVFYKGWRFNLSSFCKFCSEHDSEEDQRKREGRERWVVGRASLRYKETNKEWGPHNSYPICSYRSKQSFAVKTQRCNLRPAKSRRVHEFWKAYYTDEEKAWRSPEKPSTRVPDSAECHALMEGLMYVLFHFLIWVFSKLVAS